MDQSERWNFTCAKKVEDMVVECTNKFFCLMENNERTLSEPQHMALNKNGTTSKKHLRSSNNDKRPEVVKTKVTIFGDSHAKACVPNLQKIFSHREAFVSGNVYPGAPLSHVYKKIEETISHQNYNNNDVIVIVGGTNSIDIEEERIEELLNVLLTKTNHTNVVLTTIPYRYDQPQMNKKIQHQNKKIYKIAESQNISFIPINNLLTREHYTRHGLHLNKQGKDVFCTAIGLHVSIKLHSKTIRITTTKITKPKTVSPFNLIQQNTLGSKLHTSDPSQYFKGFSTPVKGKLDLIVDLVKENDEQPISVVETQVKKPIKDLQSDGTVDFAHIISADFESDRIVTPDVSPHPVQSTAVIQQPRHKTNQDSLFLEDLRSFPPL